MYYKLSFGRSLLLIQRERVDANAYDAPVDLTIRVVEGHTAKVFGVIVASGVKGTPSEETLARLVSKSMWIRIWSAGLEFRSSCARRRCSYLRMPKAFCSLEGTSVIFPKGKISCHLPC